MLNRKFQEFYPFVKVQHLRAGREDDREDHARIAASSNLRCRFRAETRGLVINGLKQRLLRVTDGVGERGLF